MDSIDRRNSSEDMVSNDEEVIQKETIIKKNYSTIKEENDKLRTYLGLVKMCNYSAISKVKIALNDSFDSINGCVDNSEPVDSALIVRQLEIIQNEITNMQSMHSKLEEGIESFQIIETNNNSNNTNDDSNEQNSKETVFLLTTRYDVPRKSTGIRKSISGRNKSKSKKDSVRESSFNAKLLNRIVDNKGQKSIQPLQSTVVCGEQQEAVASIDNISLCEERENVSETNDVLNTTIVRVKTTKKPYISEEFKTSHLQRLYEAKRRREEMNKQLEREGKRKPKAKKMTDDNQLNSIADFGKKSPKKRQIKKKTVSKVVSKKKIPSQTIVTQQSIVLPINQSTLDSLTNSGQTIQIIASGTPTQILCRNDGTFVPSANNWQTTAQWTTADATAYSTQNQWNQYSS